MRAEYLLVGVIASVGVIALDWLLHTNLLRRRQTYLYLAVMFVCQILFDGYLTARPLTIYDPCCLLGPRLWTIPIEEFLFGFPIFLLPVVMWVWAGRRWPDTARDTAAHKADAAE